MYYPRPIADLLRSIERNGDIPDKILKDCQAIAAAQYLVEELAGSANGGLGYRRVAPSARALLARTPLWLRPLLHRLRCGQDGFIRRLPSYYGTVRLLATVHHRLRLIAFPMRTGGACRPSIARSPGCRARSVCTCQVLRSRRAERALAMMHLFLLSGCPCRCELLHTLLLLKV